MPFGYTKANYDNAPPIAFVQQSNAESTGTPGDTWTTTMSTQAQKKGNCNIVFMAVSVGADFTSIADTAGNTYTQITNSGAVTESPGGQTRTLFAFICPSIRASPVGNIITATFTTSTLAVILMVGEYSGPVAFIDNFSSVTGAQAPSTTLTNASPTTNIVVGGFGWNTSLTPAPGTGFTSRINVHGGTDSYMMQDQLVFIPGVNTIGMTNMGPSGSTVGSIMISVGLR